MISAYIASSELTKEPRQLLKNMKTKDITKTENENAFFKGLFIGLFDNTL